MSISTLLVSPRPTLRTSNQLWSLTWLTLPPSSPNGTQPQNQRSRRFAGTFLEPWLKRTGTDWVWSAMKQRKGTRQYGHKKASQWVRKTGKRKTAHAVESSQPHSSVTFAAMIARSCTASSVLRGTPRSSVPLNLYSFVLCLITHQVLHHNSLSSLP